MPIRSLRDPGRAAQPRHYDFLSGGWHRDRTCGPFHVKDAGPNKIEADRGFSGSIQREQALNTARTHENVGPL
jgi:hypothetical protein